MSDNHYVDNKKLYAAIVQYREDVAKAIKKKKERPLVPNYIGECILMIANRLSHKPNFVNYSYREEMISDGIENCISYIDNFDPAKSNNPFAYFTQIIFFAFLRRIQKEKKQLYIKHKLSESYLTLDDIADIAHVDDDQQHVMININNENAFDFIKTFEDNLSKKKKKKKGIEKFIDEKEGS